MLDKKAQKSLLENAVAVNEIILGAAVKHYDELEKGLEKAKEADDGTGDNFHQKLYETANESQVIDMAKFIAMYGEPVTGSTSKDPKYVVKQEIKESIKKIQDLMEQRKIDDEAVEEKLKIAKETSTVSSISRTSVTLKDLIDGDYFKTGDPIISINNTDKIIAFSLKVKSTKSSEPEMFIFYLYKMDNKKMIGFQLKDTDMLQTDFSIPTSEEEKENDYISTVKEMKKNIYFLAWDAAVEPTAPAPPSGIADKTYVFTRIPTSLYEPISASMDSEAYYFENKSKNQYILYLPIQKDNALAYLSVKNKDTFTVEEVESSDFVATGKSSISNDEDGVKEMKEKNPDFYKWWEEQNFTSPTIAAAPSSTFSRGSENIVNFWKQKTKQHADSTQPYSDLEVGQAVHVSGFKGDKNSLNELRIITRSKTDLEKDAEGIEALKTVIYVNKEKILSYKVESSKTIPPKQFVNRDANILIGWLRDEKLRKQFNDMLASVEYLGAKFQDITEDDVKESA